MDIHSFIHFAQAAEEASHTVADPSLAGMFGISWKLFIAQLVNFGIVLLVLWKWVFTPVTRALQKRTARIEASLQHAEQVAKDKEQFEVWRKDEIAKTRKEASDIITKAQDEAEQVKKLLTEQARAEQEQIVVKAKAEIAQETEKSLRDAKKQLADIVIQATEKILQSKLDAKKDTELVESALKNL